MIPRIIHYCWFGGNPMPPLAEKCIKSWYKYCGDYEIREWNEQNFDISAAPLFVRQAYEAKKWAFVTDYVRLYLIYHHGGIYLDTDVELLKSPDELLEHKAYFGFENYEHIATGLGFGAEKGMQILKDMMSDYETMPFIKEDGQYNIITCPVLNTAVLQKYGLKQNGTKQVLEGDILILPSVYLCPISYHTGKKRIRKNTVSIHHFAATWQSEQAKKIHKEQARKNRQYEFLCEVKYFPRILLKAIVGERGYEKLKKVLRRNR